MNLDPLTWAKAVQTGGIIVLLFFAVAVVLLGGYRGLFVWKPQHDETVNAKDSEIAALRRAKEQLEEQLADAVRAMWEQTEIARSNGVTAATALGIIDKLLGKGNP